MTYPNQIKSAPKDYEYTAVCCYNRHGMYDQLAYLGDIDYALERMSYCNPDHTIISTISYVLN